MIVNAQVFAYGYGRCSKSETVQAYTRVWQEKTVLDYFNYKLAQKGALYQGMFFDPDTSGGTKFFSRKAASALNSQLRSGDHFIIAKLDRGFRNPIDGWGTLDNFNKRGIVVHILDYGLDTTTSIGEFVIGVSLLNARWERRVCAERTRAVLQWKRSKGFPTGGNHIPLGWSICGKKRNAVYVVNQQERDFCRQIVELLKGTTRERLCMEWERRGLSFRGTTSCSCQRIARMQRAVKKGFPLPNGNLAAGKLDEQFTESVESIG